MKTARSITHPTRLVTIYEDIDITTTCTQSTKRKNTSTIEAEYEEKMKKTKTDKADGSDARPEGAPIKKEKALSDKQRARFQKMVEKIEGTKTDVEKAIADCGHDKYKEYMVDKFTEVAKNFPLELTALQAELGVVLEEGWKGRCNDVDARVKKSIADAKAATRRLEDLMENIAGVIEIHA